MASTVRRRGTDSSGRPIYASDKLWRVWLQIVADPRLKSFRSLIVITQGSWMSLVDGGGASASAGVHDRGGCFDLRSRDLSNAQKGTLIKVIREHAGAAWVRTKAQGFSKEHIHINFGWDDDLAPAASRQWTAYLNGRDGLKGNGPDYHPRPSPLVTKPPRRIRPPRVGVLAARARAVIAIRYLRLASRWLAKSKDPALVELRTSLKASEADVRRALAKAPRR